MVGWLVSPAWLGFPDTSVVALDDAVQVAKLVSDPRIGRIKTMEKREKAVGFHGILWDFMGIYRILILMGIVLDFRPAPNPVLSYG